MEKNDRNFNAKFSFIFKFTINTNGFYEDYSEPKVVR